MTRQTLAEQRLKLKGSTESSIVAQPQEPSYPDCVTHISCKDSAVISLLIAGNAFAGGEQHDHQTAGRRVPASEGQHVEQQGHAADPQGQGAGWISPVCHRL